MKWPKFLCKQLISSVQMQFKWLVVKVLLNFMVSFQAKLHAMYYLIDCFLLLNIHLFPPPVLFLISREDNNFSGKKGEQQMSWRGVYLKNKVVGGKWLPKTGSFTRTHPPDIFAVGVWEGTTQGFFSSPPAARLLKPDISLKHCPPPPGQAVSTVNYSRTSVKQQEQPVSSFWAC